MTGRPEPRKSALAGSSPALPSIEQPLGRQAATPAEPAPIFVARPAAGRSPSPSAPTRKVSFYQDGDEAARMRAALLNTQHLEGSRTLSDFISRAVMAEVERLEQRYNRGKPWTPVGAGQLPQGRPLRG
jgi:hypothetical protein